MHISPLQPQTLSLYTLSYALSYAPLCSVTEAGSCGTRSQRAVSVKRPAYKGGRAPPNSSIAAITTPACRTSGTTARMAWNKA